MLTPVTFNLLTVCSSTVTFSVPIISLMYNFLHVDASDPKSKALLIPAVKFDVTTPVTHKSTVDVIPVTVTPIPDVESRFILL